MASMKDIKRRKASVQSTQQITKAMKLVATAKLQKAKQQAIQARPYYKQIHHTISSILAQSKGVSHSYTAERQGKRNLYLVITSNRGLAGGYNNNIIKLVANHHQAKNDEEASVLAVGRKGQDGLRKLGFDVVDTYNQIIEDPRYEDAKMISEKVIELFKGDKVDNVYIVYTSFQSTLSQEPVILKLLPLNPEEFVEEVEKGDGKSNQTAVLMNYEPSAEAVLDYIVPKYIKSLILGALKESAASEHGARMTAMDSATNNANDMIDKLTLMYNRARQASITQEITEIVSGADAL